MHRKITIGDIINFLYPTIFTIIIFLLAKKLNCSYKVKGMNNVLSSIITFTSIVIAFYTSMYGILITIKDSRIMKEIRQNHVNGIFKYQLYESLIISFIVLILSIFLQISINYSGKLEEILFECWIFCVSYFAFSTYRIINLLLKIIFTADAQEQISKNEKSEEQKRQQLQRINKLNRQKKNN